MKRGLTLLAAVALATGCANMGHKHADEDEVDMAFDKVPAAVQATLTKEAGGATIKTVERETEHGEVTYEADVKTGGKTWEIKVAEDGKLISKEIEDKDEDD